MKNRLLILIFVLSNTLSGYAQVAVNSNGNSADASAMLDVSSDTAGILIPRMTATQRDAINNPAQGLMVFVTDDNTFYFYSGIKWIPIKNGVDNWNLSGSNLTVSDTTYSVGIGTSSPSGTFEVATIKHSGTYGSDVCTGGTPSASSSYTTSTPDRVFDNDASTEWLCNNALPSTLQYDFGDGNKKRISKYRLYYEHPSSSYDHSPDDWTFEASNDGSTWTILDTQTGQGWASNAWKEYTFSNITNYRYYRFNISDNKGVSDNYVQINEAEMMEESLSNDATFIVTGNKVGIGTSSPGATLDVSGTFKLTDGNEASGKVLTSDASGNAGWTDASVISNTLDEAYDKGGAGAGKSITADAGAVHIAGTDGLLVTGTFGSGDTVNVSGQGTRMFFNPRKAAFRAGYAFADEWDNSNVGDYSVGLGYSAKASGFGSVAIGEQTSANGSQSTAIGIGSTTSATASYGIAMGQWANASNTSAIAIGSSANASGNTSIAIGGTASGDHSTAINGTASGESSYAFGGTASGFHSTSFYGATASGSHSTAIGLGITTPSYKEIAMGSYNTDYTPSSSTGWNASDRLFVVGNGENTSSKSDALIIYKSGNAVFNDSIFFDSDSIGIGTITPGARLDVAGHIWQTSTGQSVFLGENAGSNDDLSDNFNVFLGYNAGTANTTGYDNTAIGYKAMEAVTDGHWNTALGHYAYRTGNYSNSTALGDAVAITANSQVRIGHNVSSIGGPQDWTNISDGRFKFDVSENVPGLDFIKKLRPVTYHLDVEKLDEFTGLPEEYINDPLIKAAAAESTKQLRTGFIAQEVEKAAQSLGYDFSGVDKPKNSNDYYGLRYAEFVVPLVKAVQEQEDKIEEQQQTIAGLKAQLKEMEVLKQRVEKLEKLLSKDN